MQLAHNRFSADGGVYPDTKQGLMRDLMRSRLAKNASWMFLGQGLNFAVQACYFILLARLLGANQYGILVGATAAVALLSQYSMLGSGLVMLRQVSRHRSEFPQYWGNVLITILSVGFLVILALACFGKWMVGPASASIIVLVAVGECTCARIAEGGGQAFQAFEQFKLMAVLTSLTNLTRLATAAGMVLVLHRATVRQWVTASLFVSCLSGAMALVLVTTRLGWPKADFRLLRERALEGVGFSVAASTTSVYNDIDKTMLSRYGMLAADGIYSMAYRVIDISCTPIRAPCPCANSTICASFAMCSSFQMPRSPGEMRPSGVTAEASRVTRPAPPWARAPRWTRCQSVAKPSSEEYWHMGETPMRFAKETERS